MDASPSTPWNDRLRQERLQRRWRQQDLADRLGTTVITIQRWERGSQQPSAYFRLKLCALFGKSAEELGLFPLVSVANNEAPSSLAEMPPAPADPAEPEPASENHLPIEESPVEAAPALESPVAVLVSTAVKQHDQQARPVLLTRRSMLAGLAIGTLASVAGGLVLIFDRASSAPTRGVEAAPLPGTTLYTYRNHSATVRAVAWSPEGQRIASAGDDRTMQVWTTSPEAGQVQHIYQHINPVYAVAWSPDGRWVASTSRIVQVWDPTTAQRRLIYRGHSDTVSSVAWSPDGRYLASGSHDHSVHIWDAHTAMLHIGPLKHQNQVSSVAWSPDGRYLASGSTDHTVRIWDAQSGQQLQVYQGHTRQVNAVAWSVDGEYLASGGGDQTLHVWKPLGGEQSVRSPQTSEIWAVAWSPRRLQVTAGSEEGTVRVVDEPGGTVRLSYNGHYHAVRSVAWSPDGTRIASSGLDMKVRIWQAI